MTMVGCLKQKLRQACAWGYHQSNHALSRLQNKAVILTYHRVLSEKELAAQFVQPGMYVRDDVFAMHLRFFAENFDVLRFADLLDMWSNGRWDKKARYCVITFDDGWLDNYVHAFPLLKRYKLPATIFLPTAFVGTDEWFWPDKIGYLLGQAREFRSSTAWGDLTKRFPGLKCSLSDSVAAIDQAIETCKTLPRSEVDSLIAVLEERVGDKLPRERMVMNWKEAREMSSYGVTFGSHSVNHTILTAVPDEQVASELTESWQVLQKSEVAAVPVFCYPNGDYASKVADEVRRVGYQAAVTVRSGWEGDKPADLYRLRRIGMHNDLTSTISLLSWHLAGLNSPVH